eukprot:1145242-Pelagomonas_calceolata.AAC.5
MTLEDSRRYALDSSLQHFLHADELGACFFITEWDGKLVQGHEAVHFAKPLAWPSLRHPWACSFKVPFLQERNLANGPKRVYTRAPLCNHLPKLTGLHCLLVPPEDPAGVFSILKLTSAL